MKEVSLTQYHPDPVGYAMGKKEKIPGGWNIQWEANITQCDSGSVERMRRRRERLFLVDGIVRRIPVTPNMNVGQFKASWTGQR